MKPTQITMMNEKKYANGTDLSLAEDADVGAPPTRAVLVEVTAISVGSNVFALACDRIGSA